ncbi:Uncharacterised protein [uncultured archaeon]|nr:Uncharacterised protein [uncultured archaeon]
MNSNTGGAARNSVQLVLFTTEQLSLLKNQKNAGAGNRGLGTSGLPSVEKLEKPLIRALRGVLVREAKFYYGRMLKELDDPLVREFHFWVNLATWPKDEQWNWPSGRMHQNLRNKIVYVRNNLQPGRTKKQACLSWAELESKIIERLGGLDEMLRTGKLDEFFSRCRSKEGEFAFGKPDNPEGHKGERRAVPTPHYLNQMAEFRALEKEWKWEKEAGPQRIQA